jgi:peptide/nickel transport system ATP-binding protein
MGWQMPWALTPPAAFTERFMSLLNLKKLTVGYVNPSGELIPAVNDVSFNLKKGETLGIVGESGCGKSTLARAILGYCRPGSLIMGGEVLFDGKDILQMSSSQLRDLRGQRIAMVPQNPLSSLTYHMKVGPQVDEILRIHRGMDSKAARIHTLELFTGTNLPDPEQIYDRYPHEISGGQRQRVVIAGALACQPVLMVLDEPTTALDTTTEIQVLKLVKNLRKENDMALIYITHDLTLTDYICENVLVMLDGKVVEQGRVVNIFKHPQTDYTKMLIAAIPRVDAKPGADAFLPAAGVPQPLLEVDRLKFRYGQRRSLATIFKSQEEPPAVDNVSFDLEHAETIGLVGESGSGKSTIANIICGLLTPTTGNIIFDNQPINTPAEKRSLDLRRRIQIIFQDPLSSLNPRHRIETILTRPLKIFFGFKGQAVRDRAVELLEAMELLPEHLSRFPRQLSGGQQQRVAIACAFAAKPDLILCDEVTSALDVSVQAHVLELLKAIQEKTGVACVFISHDLGVVKQVANKVIVLQKGVVAEAGPTEDVFAKPTHDYTRLLLAAANRENRDPSLQRKDPSETLIQ